MLPYLTSVYPVYSYYYQIHLSLLVRLRDLKDRDNCWLPHLQPQATEVHPLPYCAESDLQSISHTTSSISSCGEAEKQDILPAANLLNLCNCTGHETEVCQVLLQEYKEPMFWQKDISTGVISVSTSIPKCIVKKTSFSHLWERFKILRFEFFFQWDTTKFQAFYPMVRCTCITHLRLLVQHTLQNFSAFWNNDINEMELWIHQRWALEA